MRPIRLKFFWYKFSLYSYLIYSYFIVITKRVVQKQCHYQLNFLTLIDHSSKALSTKRHHTNNGLILINRNTRCVVECQNISEVCLSTRYWEKVQLDRNWLCHFWATMSWWREVMTRRRWRPLRTKATSRHLAVIIN